MMDEQKRKLILNIIEDQGLKETDGDEQCIEVEEEETTRALPEETPLEPSTPPTAAPEQEQGNIPESSTTQPPASPEPESFDGAQIPQQLKNVSQWLCWQYGERDGNRTKIPINPETYGNTPAPDAAWSYEVCREAMAAGYRGDVGLGFSLRNGIVGIDLDDVLDEMENLKPEYADLESIIDKIASYTEMSPSRTGLHIVFQCDDIPPACKSGRKRKENIEMYCEGRFFTVTGLTWKYPNELRNLSAEEYRGIYSMLFGGPAEEPASSTKETSLNAIPCSQTNPTRSDSEVFFQVTRNPKYKALWEGNITGYPSASEADFALMCRLAEATGCNKEQMIQIFRKSRLADREKAERPDYLDITATNAIREVLQSQQQKNNGLRTTEEAGPELKDEDIAAARELWAGEDTLTKIITELQKIHVGDTELMKLFLLLFLQGRIDNLTETTYLTIHAERGSGKSHLIETVKTFLPPNLVHAGGMSNKYLTRVGEDWDGSLVLFDDIRLSEELAELLKICSVHGIRPVYQTLEGARNQPRECNLPMNLTFVLACVDADYGPDEEQIMNRNIVAYTRDDEEQARNTYDIIRKRAALNYTTSEGIKNIGAAFWTMIPDHILVDCEVAAHISVPKGADNRALQQCITLAMCFAVYRHWKGDMEGWDEIDESGRPIIRATEQDVRDAINLMNRLMRGDGGDIDLKLPKGAKKVYDILMRYYERKEWLKISDMYRDFMEGPAKYNHNLQTLIRAVNGRKERGTGGLVGTIAGLTKERRSMTLKESDAASTHGDVYIWDKETEIATHGERFFRWSDEILSIHSGDEEGQKTKKTEQSTIT